MALSMHTNYASLVTQNTLNNTSDLLNTAMERLSTGYRINSAADDAAGLQISNRLEMQTRGMSVAQRNAQDGNLCCKLRKVHSTKQPISCTV